MLVVFLPLSASEDSFELHSVDLELEAVEKQIHDLQMKQAQLRQRKAVLESSQTDAHLSQAQRTKNAARPGFVHSGTGVPQSLDATAAEDASQAPGEDLSPSAAIRLRDLDPELLCEMESDVVIIRDSIVWHVRATVAKGKVRTRRLPGARVLEQKHRSCGSPCWHERHQAEADEDPEEGLQEPGGEGKGRELADVMERRKVDILCVQETRWKGSKARSIGAGFKLFYYGVDSKRNGVGVVLKEEFVRNVLEVKRVSDRVMSLKLEIEGVMLNVVSGYAPQVGCELEEKERFWSELDEVMESIPTGERVVIGADFNGHVGEGNTGDEEVMGKFGVKERNLEGQMVVDFAKRMDMGVVNTYFQKREEHRVTYKSGGRSTQVVLPDDWETTAEVIRETGRKVLGVSSGRRKEDKETWWWNEEVQDSIQRKRLAKKKWDMDRTEENRQEYKELQRRVKREVSKAKQKAYEELYTRLDTREGEKDLYRLARQRDRDGKDVQQKVDKIRKDEVRKALKRMKSGKAVGPDDIPVEVWKCLGEAAVEFLANLFNRVLENLEKAYDRVPREELWYCMRKSGVAEKYVRVVQDMYERSRTVVRCAVVMDQLSEEVRQESPWTMMFADDIVICSESREQVEENLERWRFALERRGMKVSRIQSNGECGKEKISARIKGKVYRTVVRPAMLYGLETVSLRKRQESELEVAELKMLREARLRWFGHVQRRDIRISYRIGRGPGLQRPPSAPLTYRAPVEIGLLLVKEVEEGGECTDRERRGKETRWKGSKARSIGEGFKLFYYGVDSKRNGVGVVLKEEFVRNILEVKRVSDRVMSLKLEIEGVMLNVVSGYATGERVGADFNGHVGEGNTGDEEVMGKFGVKERNLEGQMVVDFAKSMDMGVVNTYFHKREEHRVTYKSGGRRTQVVLPDDWETTAEVIRETGRKVLGVSSGRRKEYKETWWWNEEVQDSVQRKRLAKKKWDMDRTDENRQEYKELQRRVKREVSKAKQKAYDELYTRLDTREGEKDLYRLARQRDRDGKDVQQKVDKIRKDEVRKALKRMKSGNAVGPDDILVEVWKCLGEAAVEFLANLFNRVLERMVRGYDRVPREELWYCMRKSGVAEKYVRVVQDMYERSRTVVRCAVGQTEEFKVEVGLHQGSALSPFLFAIVMDQLSEEVRQESSWTMMFADDIVICSESREQVEENLERWRFALERRGMKVSRSKTEYMCVNEREGSETVRLQGEEVKKVQELKYLGSTVQSNGEYGKEVKKRVQAGWNGWRKVSGVLCDRKISARIKGKVYRTVVRPAMLYGLETVSLRKRQESELEVAELKMLRFSLGVTRLDRISNEYIRGTAHVGRLGDKVREARLRWFGHVQRRESEYIGRRMLDMELPGRR
ncbi:hypothetical protein QTP70_011318 [Hemibagrus guttatus]|uniref:ribonuclease H n=1 Tax=Hemibagrus guttatus TaxID=175788 RepID=A0AAE0R7Q5_9TELE|nr:hypothetical protein QTP70_011318 [Hemibagrus guttatus]